MTIASPFPKPRYGRAFAVAWLMYIAAADYDGPVSFIGQPIMGAMFGAIIIGLIALLGLILRVPAIGQAWYRSRKIPLILITAGLIMLMFGQSLSLSEPYQANELASEDPEFTNIRTRLPFAAALPAFMIVVFAAAFLPDRKTSRAAAETSPQT